MLSYALDGSLLEPYLPTGMELDTFDGKTYLSPVGFETRRGVHSRTRSEIWHQIL